jgi:tetratricopeptide (TPR) repeat protein
MAARVLALLLCFSFFFCYSQNPQKVANLQRAIAAATTDTQRIATYGALAEYYYTYRLEKKADSLLQKQLSLAELSRNKELVLTTLFSSSINNLPNWTSIETFERAITFIEQGLDYAKEMGRDDYTALAYISKAALLRKRGQYDNALQQAMLANASIGNKKLDSIQTLLNVELADIYLAKGDAVSAYKYLNNAFDLAYANKYAALQSSIYHHFSEVYKFLNLEAQAKESLMLSLELNTNPKHPDKEGELNDYIDLARLTDEQEYIRKAMALADSLGDERKLLTSKKLMFIHYMVIEKNSSLALDYLYKNADVKQSYQNVSLAFYYWTLGNLYKYSAQPDSAAVYYLKAEPELQKDFDIDTRRDICDELGNLYATLKQPTKAIAYYEQALTLSRQQHNLKAMAILALQLSKLYADAGDFKKAYAYSANHLAYSDSAQQLSPPRDVALLGVEREDRKRERDAADAAAAMVRRRNLQYISITMAIIGLFVIMMLVGMFPVSRYTIKALSYFGFICLFEFLVMLLDTFLHNNITHGEPLKTWLIKIFLIALLVPFQHFLEHSLTIFLESRKLMQLRSLLDINQWWRNKNVPPHHRATDFEEDTAVL